MTLLNLVAPYKAISIIGLAKNVGKTTVLNHLMANIDKPMAITSIGRDGEDIDVVTHKEKPRIHVSAGVIVITAKRLLDASQIRYKTLLETGWSSALGEIVIIQALSNGRVQIGGPSMVNQLEELLLLLGEHELDKIFIDGALGRKSLAKPSIAEACILCTGAALSTDINEVIMQTRHAVNILSLPKNNSLADALPMPGAISDEKILRLIMENKLVNKTILVDDPTKIFINQDTYKKMTVKQVSLTVKNPINLLAVTVNPTSPNDMPFDASNFLDEMRQNINIPVFDVML